eukprot:COSAG04_NODE_34_length_34523_cov_40.302446_21_plen_226_part_00
MSICSKPTAVLGPLRRSSLPPEWSVSVLLSSRSDASSRMGANRTECCLCKRGQPINGFRSDQVRCAPSFYSVLLLTSNSGKGKETHVGSSSSATMLSSRGIPCVLLAVASQVASSRRRSFASQNVCDANVMPKSTAYSRAAVARLMPSRTGGAPLRNAAGAKKLELWLYAPRRKYSGVSTIVSCAEMLPSAISMYDDSLLSTSSQPAGNRDESGVRQHSYLTMKK